jgi:hypothetical protein
MRLLRLLSRTLDFGSRLGASLDQISISLAIQRRQITADVDLASFSGIVSGVPLIMIG